MVIKRLFNVLRSQVYDFVERKEQELDLDPEMEKEFKEWKRQQKAEQDKKYKEKYDEYKRPASKRLDKDAKYFKALEMEPSKDFKVIKKQYRTMIKKYHPDRFNNDDKKRASAVKITTRLNEAYEYFQKKHGVN